MDTKQNEAKRKSIRELSLPSDAQTSHDEQ